MKNARNKILAFAIALPLAFTIIFLGYLPPHFDAVIYVDNIVGEGTCSTYILNLNKTFAHLYTADAYFGSELKTLKLKDLQYNVDEVALFMYDVEEADILSFDISVFGRTVAHLNKDGVTHPFTVTTNAAISSQEEPLAHLVIEKDDYTGMSFPGSTLIPGWVWAAYFGFILLVAAALAIGVYFLLERVPAIRLPLLTASAIMATMLLGCYLCDSLAYADYTDFLLNWLLFFAAAVLINALTLPWVGTAAVSLFAMVWYIANFFVIRFRNKPIMPADLRAFGTAREVAGSYDLRPTWQIVVYLGIVLLYVAAAISLWARSRPKERRPLKSSLLGRGIGVFAAIAMLFFGVNNPAFSTLNDFQWDARLLEGFSREGILLTFVKSAMTAYVKKPEGYTREAANAYLSDYNAQSAPAGIQPTRIIMVMNEAFSDLRTVGLDGSIDVMPFIDSLDENTLEGRLYVSIIGGGTCNTEFEGLTGNTLAFFGAGAYPYTENVTRPLFSLASYFKNSGYVTEAFHANDAHNWNRDMVYPNLGFDVFHSIESYPPLTDDNYLRNYTTDATDYSLIEARDAENAGRPRFLFNVTIQNHGDYEHFINVEQAETLTGHEDTLERGARVYLSLLMISDDSIRQLLEKYRDSDEPTMIVFFGDHQPMLSNEAQQQVYTQIKHYIDYFQSKFFIWTNYRTETKHDVSISANYLPWLILERGNFPLPPYVQMLKEVYEKYPVLSSQGVMDSTGNIFDNVAILADDPLIQKYHYIQYANLMGELDPAWFEVK